MWGSTTNVSQVVRDANAVQVAQDAKALNTSTTNLLKDAHLLNLSPPVRQEKLKMWLRQLGNREDELLNPIQAAQELAHQAQTAMLRVEINALLRLEPTFILFLQSMVESPQLASAKAAVECIHNLVWPQTQHITADGLQAAAHFLLTDLMVDKTKFADLPLKVIQDMISCMTSMLQYPETKEQCATILRHFMFMTVDVWEKMSPPVKSALFTSLATMLASTDPLVAREGARAAHWLVECNSATVDKVVEGLDLQTFIYFVNSILSCLEIWRERPVEQFNSPGLPVGCKHEDLATTVWGMLFLLAHYPANRHRLLFMSGSGNAEPEPSALATATAMLQRNPTDGKGGGAANVFIAHQALENQFRDMATKLIHFLIQNLHVQRYTSMATGVLSELVAHLPFKLEVTINAGKRMSCPEAFILLCPTALQPMFVGLAQAFRSFTAAGNVPEAKEAMETLRALIDTTQLQRWLVSRTTAGGVIDLVGAAACLNRVFSAMTALFNDLAQAMGTAPPTVALAATAKNNLAVPTQANSSNEVFPGDVLSPDWQLCEAILDSLEPLMNVAPVETTKALSLHLPELTAGLGCLLQAAHYTRGTFRCGQLLGKIINFHDDPTPLLTPHLAVSLCKMAGSSIVHPGAAPASEVYMMGACMDALGGFAGHSLGEDLLLRLLRGGEDAPSLVGGWLSSMVSSGGADHEADLFRGLVYATRLDELSVADKAVAVLAMLANHSDTFGINSLMRQPQPLLTSLFRRLIELLNQAAFSSCQGKYMSYRYGLQRNSLLVVHSIIFRESSTIKTARNQLLLSLCGLDTVALCTGLRQLQMCGDLDSEGNRNAHVQPATSDIAKQTLSAVTKLQETLSRN